MSNPFGASWGSRTYVMGVLNVTPDSFSGDGFSGQPGEAARRARICVEAGADFVDIGGESTRPGYAPVPLDEELRRTVPAVRAAAQEVDVPVSVDTTKVEVARQAIQAGAAIVNDVSGGTADDMLRLVAESRAGLVMVHQGRGGAGTDVVAAVKAGLEEAAQRAREHGVSADCIVLDPGLGFGKTWRENFEIFRRLPELSTLGYPMLLGPSRKGMIGKVLGVGVDDRMEGTLALVALAVAAGADAVRVHDVREMSRAARVLDALAR